MYSRLKFSRANNAHFIVDIVGADFFSKKCESILINVNIPPAPSRNRDNFNWGILLGIYFCKDGQIQQKYPKSYPGDFPSLPKIYDVPTFKPLSKSVSCASPAVNAGSNPLGSPDKNVKTVN